MEFKKYNKCAGIYKWQNKINGKCYIGQSIDLGSRLRHHINNFKHRRYDAPLYRAFDKYGLDSFDIEILYYIENPERCIKPFLDELEIGYIEKYNSYGGTGYNQTRGGDAGILGYKFTEEQRNRTSANSIISGKNISKKIVLYNIKTGWLLIFPSISFAAKQLNTTHGQVSRLCSWSQYLLDKQWVGAFETNDVYKRAEYINQCPFDYKTEKSSKTSNHRYSIEIYENKDLIYKFKNTTEANKNFFHFNNKRCVLSTVVRTINKGTKYKGIYTFKLVDKKK